MGQNEKQHCLAGTYNAFNAAILALIIAIVLHTYSVVFFPFRPPPDVAIEGVESIRQKYLVLIYQNQLVRSQHMGQWPRYQEASRLDLHNGLSTP
jgi:hypothetical protein